MNGLKEQRFIGSQVWRLEIGNQSIGRAVLSLPTLGEDPSLPLLASGVCRQSMAFLGCRHSTPVTWLSSPHVSLHWLTPVYVCLCVQISPFHKDTSQLGSGSTQIPHFNLTTSVRPYFHLKSHSGIFGA